MWTGAHSPHNQPKSSYCAGRALPLCQTAVETLGCNQHWSSLSAVSISAAPDHQRQLLGMANLQVQVLTSALAYSLTMSAMPQASQLGCIEAAGVPHSPLRLQSWALQHSTLIADHTVIIQVLLGCMDSIVITAVPHPVWITSPAGPCPCSSLDLEAHHFRAIRALNNG